MKRRQWTQLEVEQLRELYPHYPTEHVLAVVFKRTPRQLYAKAGQLGLAKSPEYLASPWAQRLRKGTNRGGSTRFKPGQVPANKGLRRPGWAPGRMAETQFKKGERRGRANNIWRPVGSERISKDGYLERKVSEDRPFQRRWKAVHRIVWEEHHGPIPKGHAVVFRAGQQTTDPHRINVDGLELVTRGELMRRNSYHTNYPKPVRELIQLRAALNRKIRNREAKREEQDPRRP